MDFITLDRFFVTLTKDQEPSLDIGRFWGPRVSGWLGWEELKRRRRVILLAEAASGKTEEFRHQCEVIKAAGSPAFFLRIEELADQGTETALDSESAKQLENWLAGSGEGWFFLDSVDEARLNRKSFDAALRRFAKDIGVGLERAHVYSHIRPKDDPVRRGSYSPDARDHAQNAREGVLSVLLGRPGADAYQAMKRLAEDPVFALRSHRFRELARGKAERDAENPAWNAAEVLTFQRQFTAPVKTGVDLLRVVLGVLGDIAQNLTHGDVTSRPLLERAKDEEEVQHWLVEQMNARARCRFHAFREAEVATGDKPDIIIASTSAPCEVAIEVKHGGKGWTARDLEHALRTQLAEDYLKPESRRHGVLVITHHRDRRWLDISNRKPISFLDLIEWLSGIATTLTENAVGSIAVKCIGIDAWKSGGNLAAPRRTIKKAKPPSNGRDPIKAPEDA
jgi:hypothetical protein